MRTSFTDNLKSIRVARGLRQSELARRLEVSRATLHGWESGRRKPDLEQASALATALGCTVDELIRPKEVSSTWPTADEMPGAPKRTYRPRVSQDPAEWARGYQDGFRDRPAAAETADSLAYAAGRVEGEAGRLAGTPRARLAHLLAE